MPTESTPSRSAELRAAFADPPREFGMMPFWFWNDDLQEEEIVRQIREFHAAGFGGFIPHARSGLSRRVGYLTDEWFRLVRVAVEEARRLGMKVVLYDEGAYPSGSAQGRVVAENPEYASRCLIALHHRVAGPKAGYWRPNPGRALQDRLVCVVLGREGLGLETGPNGANTLDPESLRLVPPQGPGLVRYDLPEGQWRLVAVWDVASGGTIRGVFDEEEDASALAPAAGDIMNPEAVACFLRHTHDRYYAALKEHFGETILAMFTDEPSAMGRGPRRGPSPKPYTAGLLEDVQTRWNDDARRWLPALWLECGPRTGEFRRLWDRAVHERIENVFYAAQSRWCAAHGIALTGHPAASNEMAALRHFQWPGQDIVWRYVEPGARAALEGEHSVAAKAASSAAVVGSRPRSATESLGAFGWRLTLDEAKWVLDWHLARGNNTVFTHACFYSIRGRRAYESEPDLGLHNVWWPHFRVLGDYTRRVCWLLSGGEEVCDVAILTDPDAMSWRAARELLRAQVDFVYVDDAALAAARLEEGRLRVGSGRFRAVLFDSPGSVGPAARARLDALRAAGGLVLETWRPEDVVSHVRRALAPDLDWPNAPDLRALHYRKEGLDLYLLVNEGEEMLEGMLSLAAVGALELWDPLDGSARLWRASVEGDRMHTRLRLERRQGLVLTVDPKGTPRPDAPFPPVPGAVAAEVPGPWHALDEKGQVVDAPCPGDWARHPAWETFSETLRFRGRFETPAGWQSGPLFLDLGRVGDIAEVRVNGRPVGLRAWAPYVVEIGRACRPGANDLEVRVTNTMANAYDGLQMPSGLMGPVVLRRGEGWGASG